MTPARLFKYQRSSQQSVENVVQSALWFSAPVKFNDPFDCALVIHRRRLTDEEFAQVFKRELQRKGPVMETRYAGGHGDPGFRGAIQNAVNMSFDQQRERHLHLCGVSCFAERNDNLLMWAHYGFGHTGFCLAFDTSHEPFSRARQVEYCDTVPELSPVDLLATPPPQDGRYERAMLLTKSACWSYEQEWRLIHAEAERRIGYPPAALTGVYIGCNADGADVHELLAHAKAQRIPAYRMERSSRGFALHPRRI